MRPEVKALICELCRMKHGVKPLVCTPSPRVAKGFLWMMGVREWHTIKIKMTDETDYVICTVFALDRAKLENLLREKPIDDLKLGIHLGYPRCCVKRYVENGAYYKAFNRYKRMCEEYGEDPFQLEMVEVDEDYYLTWSQVGFISWIPCKPTCQKSRESLATYLNLCRSVQCPILVRLHQAGVS